MKTFFKILVFVLLTITFSGCTIQEEFVYGHYYPTTHYVVYEGMSPYHHRTVIKVKRKPHQHKKPIQKPPQNRRKPSNNRNHRR